MKTPEEYQELVEQLDELNKNWDKGQGCDAAYFAIRFTNQGWRFAKKCGAKKDYCGWVLWSCSTNSDSTGLSTEIAKLIKGFGLSISERQL